MRHNELPPMRAAIRPRLSLGLIALSALLSLAACGGASPSAETPRIAPPPDGLDEYVERVRETVSAWETGVGIALRIREGAGEPQTLLFAETSPPTYSEEIALWTIATIAAAADNTVLGHMMVGLPALEPGTPEGDADKRELVVAMLLASEPWSGQHPAAAWSINPGSHAKLRLSENAAGDLEGELTATLVSNDGTRTFTVERGFIYLKR